MFSTPLLTLFPLLLLLLLTTLTSPTTAAFSAGGDGVIPEEYRNQARDLVRFTSPIQAQGQGQQPQGQVEMLKKHFKRSVIKGKRGLSKGKRGCKAVTTTTTSVGAGSAIPTTSGGMVGSTLAPTAMATSTGTTSEGSKTFESLVVSSSSSLPIVNAPVIPSTTSTKATPSATSKPATTTSTTSTPAQTSAASTFTSPDQEGNGPFDGESTYYVLGTDGNAIGACGNNLVDSDLIAAASEYLFDSWPGSNGNPNQNPICGQYAKVSYQGKSVVVRIEDRCPGCEKRHLDLSPSAFSQLASFDVGMMDVTWEWVGSASG